MLGVKLKKELKIMDYRLEDSVNHRVATLAVLLKRQVFRIIAENKIGITPDQWVIMYCLWQENELSVGEISNRTKKDFANVTRILDKLEKIGYVTKVKNTNDNRSTNIHILPKADEIKNKLQNCWIESTELAMRGISKEEQILFLNTIEKIEKNILVNLK